MGEYEVKFKDNAMINKQDEEVDEMEEVTEMEDVNDRPKAVDNAIPDKEAEIVFVRSRSKLNERQRANYDY